MYAKLYEFYNKYISRLLPDLENDWYTIDPYCWKYTEHMTYVGLHSQYKLGGRYDQIYICNEKYRLGVFLVRDVYLDGDTGAYQYVRNISDIIIIIPCYDLNKPGSYK